MTESSTRAALYLDFDNVFGAMLGLDPASALEWAENPSRWLSRLTEHGSSRRWLVLRCYMNPDGRVKHPVTGTPVRFSQFRRAFTNAGFEIVDCPRLSNTKNAADIRLVVDALDAVHSPLPYDEFVIGSGDSDMTPLLVRLRAAARSTLVISPSESAASVLSAVADHVIDGPGLVTLVAPESDDPEVAEAAEGIANDDVISVEGTEALPDPVVQVSRAFEYPRLPRGAWSLIAEGLSNFVQSNGYNLTHATRWVRDDLASRGTAVGRRAPNAVVSGAAHGGCPLYRKPAPTGDEILTAFAQNVVDRARSGDAEFTDQELQLIGDWFRAPMP